MNTTFGNAMRAVIHARTPDEEAEACRALARLIGHDFDRAVIGSRLDRQSDVHTWCRAAFGDDHARSITQRGVRLAEEAIEAAQAAGCDPAMLHRLIDHVYSKPVGNLAQEIGGVGVTLLALAQAASVDADLAELNEFSRVLSMPLEHFAKRNAAKNAAGFNVLHGEGDEG